VVKVNVDENPEYATQYQVQRTPTIIFFATVRKLTVLWGAGRKPIYTEKIDALLD
jgi:thioredoxin-like negative regulator of GroEL